MSKWKNTEDELPKKEGYYTVKFEDGTVDEKPFRVRPKQNIKGFMTEGKVIQWK